MYQKLYGGWHKNWQSLFLAHPGHAWEVEPGEVGCGYFLLLSKLSLEITGSLSIQRFQASKVGFTAGRGPPNRKVLEWFDIFFAKVLSL